MWANDLFFNQTTFICIGPNFEKCLAFNTPVILSNQFTSTVLDYMQMICKLYANYMQMI